MLRNPGRRATWRGLTDRSQGLSGGMQPTLSNAAWRAGEYTPSPTLLHPDSYWRTLGQD